ncbi:MAG TPA: arginine--tRNA ligase [Gemmatimonadaceae bacterium]|nr:arginine--tRNA ligase [Gemmatimonadaceae bacterium]
MTPVDLIRAALVGAARELGAPDTIVPVLERPRDPANGDWSTNLAMLLAKPLGDKPRALATRLIEKLDLGAAGVSKVDIAGPGFINFYLAAGANASGLAAIVAQGDSYGRDGSGAGRRVVVEFVSANPTGPLHVGHGRQAVLGDAISALLEWTGWSVSREYYYNDAGVQIQNLAASVVLRLRELAGHPAVFPEGWYQGDYVVDVARAYVADRGARDAMELLEREMPPSLLVSYQNDPEALAPAILDFVRTHPEFVRVAVNELRRQQDRDLKAFGISFDTYFLESSLYAPGSARTVAPMLGGAEGESAVDATVRALASSGNTYEEDGALWLRTTDFGDDKNRVMRKRDGTYTYFLPDVAYHVSKWGRGFTRAINVQGTDHHGTTARVRAGLQALAIGIPKGYPAYVLHNLVKLMRGGEEVKFSKRSGSIVTLEELIAEVGRDAVRYFFSMRKAESELVFDIDLARAESEENPVYYIQMAHARLSGIFRVGNIDPLSIAQAEVAFDALAEPEERELIKALLDFPALLAGAAESYEPHRLASYLHDTAQLVHLWYHKHHVLGEPPRIMNARLFLALASRIVLRNGLAVLGIDAPERM